MIQPFDGGAFDRRYEDVLVPAITAAGLEAYRVDRDPSVTIPIDQIEAAIRAAQACVADISRDNPNVWFELGYAIAAAKPVVLLALDEEHRRFPFDIQHRHVVRYRTGAPSDFAVLQADLTTRLQAILAKEERLERVVRAPSIANVEGLSQHEFTALVSIAENMDSPTSGVPAGRVRNDMERAGFTRVAVTVALGQLARKGLATYQEERDWNDTYIAYFLTERGVGWLHENENLLLLRQEPATSRSSQSFIEDEDELPF